MFNQSLSLSYKEDVYVKIFCIILNITYFNNIPVSISGVFERLPILSPL